MIEKMIFTKCVIEKSIDNFQKRPNSDKYYGTCKLCKNEYAKLYRKEKAEQISKQRKQHYRENIDLMKERSKKYLEEHKEEVYKRNKEYYKKNAKELNAKSRKYYKEHNEEIRAQKKIYNEEHKDEYKLWRKKYYELNKEHIKEYHEQYRPLHSEEHKEYMKEYYKSNKEMLKEYKKIYNITHKEEIRARQIKYENEHKEERRLYRQKYRNERLSKDSLFKMTVNIRHLINNSFRRQGYSKKAHTYEIVGCEYEVLYNHLLETFKENYGYEWDGKEEVHIDHIIPLAIAETEEDIYELCYYENLQLLKAKDNLEKHDKLDYKIDNK